MERDRRDKDPEEAEVWEWDEAGAWAEWEEPARVPAQVVTVSVRSAGRLPLIRQEFPAIKQAVPSVERGW